MMPHIARFPEDEIPVEAPGLHCPECGHGEYDTSPHYRFAKNVISHRCRKCRHIWDTANPAAAGPPGMVRR